MNPRMSGIADDARGVAATGSTLSADHVAVEPGLLAGGEVEVVHAELAGLGEQRVVDVGDVAHALHRVAEVDQPALEDVVEHERRRVAEVGGVVRGDPARVHQHVRVGLERHHRLAGGVVQAHVTRSAPAPCRRPRRGAAVRRPASVGLILMPVSFGATRVL